nr:MAG TPA: hypothetical protein [Caudoviricetes sp.]
MLYSRQPCRETIVSTNEDSPQYSRENHVFRWTRGMPVLFV